MPIVGVDPNALDASQSQNPTAAQIAQMYQYANLLNKDSLSPVPGTKGGWTVGMKNMVSALMGGLQGRWADQYQQNADKNSRTLQQSSIPLPAGAPPAAAPLVKPMSFAPEDGVPASAALPNAQNPYAFGDSAPSDTKSALPEGAPKLSPSEGSNPAFIARLFKIRSSGNPNAVTGSNRGLGQFGPKEEAKYGINDSNRTNPDAQAAAVRAESKVHSGVLAKSLGRDPTPGELYLTHQQGIAGGPALLTGGDQPAWKALRPYYKSDRMAKLAVSGNLPRDSGIDPNTVSAKQFAGYWVNKFERGMSGAPTDASLGPSPQPLAFNAEASKLANDPDMQSMLLAISDRKMPAVKPSAPQGINPPPGGPQYLPSGVIPGASRWTPETLAAFMQNHATDPALKALAIQQYMGTQVNPQSIPVPGGHVLIGKNGKQVLIPDLQWNEQRDAAGQTRKVPQVVIPPTYGSGGSYQMQTIDEPPSAPSAPAPSGPQGMPPPLPKRMSIDIPDVAAPAAPAVAPPAPPAVAPAAPAGIPGINTAPPAVAPPAPIAPPVSPGSAGNTLPMGQVGALPGNALALNDTGTASDAISPVGQAATAAQAIQQAQAAVKPPPLPGAAPPVGDLTNPMGAGVAAALAQAPPELPGVKTAENFADWSRRGIQTAAELEAAKTLAGEGAKQYNKNSNTYMDLGGRAQKAIPMLQAADELAKDPRYYSGVGADWVQAAKRAWSLIPGNEGAAAPMEIFDKIASGDIVSELKTQLGGLGQVRVAEIQLITNSVANKYNTPTANRAVLKVMGRQNEQAATIGKIAENYDKGWTLNDQDQWVRREGPPTNAGLEGVVNDYTKRNPLFTKDEINNIQKTFNIAKAEGKVTPNQAVNAAQVQRELEVATKNRMEQPAATPAAAAPALPGETPPPAAAPTSPTVKYQYDEKGNLISK